MNWLKSLPFLSQSCIWLFFTLRITLQSIAAPVHPASHTNTSSLKGLPFIHNYHPKLYNHLTTFPDTWTIVEDDQGAMLIGNSGGILRYNGNNWQFIETPSKSIVRALAKDKTGQIFVGTPDDLGYLAPDSSGKLQFISLLSHLPEQYQKFGDMYKIFASPEGIYFQTQHYIFRWQHNKFIVWQAETSFTRSFFHHNRLYIQQSQKGLFTLTGDTLTLVSDLPFFTETPLQVMLPLPDGSYLVGNRTGGLFLYDGKSIQPFTTSASKYVQENRLYYGISLPNQSIALATLAGGVVIINQQAELQQILDKTSGLTSNAIYSLTADREGNLWVAMDKGISHVEINSPFSFIDERNGIQGSIKAVHRHQNKLYIGTSMGLFEQEHPAGTTLHFRKVQSLNTIVFTLYSLGKTLLVGTNDGIFELENGSVNKISAVPCVDIEPSKFNPDVLYIASDGLFVLRKTPKGWKDEGMVPGVTEGMHTILETSTGELWLATRWQGALQVQFPNSDSRQFYKTPLVSRYGTAQGLPPGSTHLFFIGDQIILQIGDESNQLFEFTANKEFKLLTDFNKRYGLGDKMAYPGTAFQQEDSVWFWTKDRGKNNRYLALATKKFDDTYTLQELYFNQLNDYLDRLTFFEDNGIMWFGGSENIVRFDYWAYQQTAIPFNTLLDKIVMGVDSAIYPLYASKNAVLPYEKNSLRFEFAAAFYRGEKNSFQYKLEGYDDNWSEPTTEYVKEYTRIPEGTYTFRVRSVNAFGQTGKEAVYSFEILAPWYRTIPMYLLYVVLAGTVLYLLYRWRTDVLRKRTLALEALVEKRTHEVALKNEQLAQQTEKLKELDQVKSTFFANISHEFRTPLTLILNNLLDKLTVIRQHPEQSHIPVAKSEVNVMYRNSKRLLDLINQLLDLSKLESGKLQVDIRNGNLTQLLQLVFASFSSLATYRHIDFQLVQPEEPILCRYDQNKLEKILYNLLSNAFKFTPEQGKILLQAQLIQSISGTPSIQISVQDSGPGIAPDQLQKVFDRFYQGKQYYADEQGTGIGLALTKELVELHQGKIWVESEKGQGARFIFQLPLLANTAPVEEEATEPVLSLITPTLITPEQQPEQEVIVAPAAENEDLPLILVVEDNEDLCAYIRTQLEGKFRISLCKNGVEGLEKAIEIIPDLIVSDLMMPQMNGYELCTRIKTDERTSHIPVILLTAVATIEGKVTGLETGADDYLTKPFDTRELEIRIQNLITSRRKLREYYSNQLRQPVAFEVQPAKVEVLSADEKFLQRAIQVMEENMSNELFSVDDFSQEIGMSRMQLHRKLKSLTNHSASDFIRIMRLKRAAQLLEARAGNVTEISYQVGFNSLAYFSKCFHDYFGIQPKEYATKCSQSVDTASY